MKIVSKFKDSVWKKYKQEKRLLKEKQRILRVKQVKNKKKSKIIKEWFFELNIKESPGIDRAIFNNFGF